MSTETVTEILLYLALLLLLGLLRFLQKWNAPKTSVVATTPPVIRTKPGVQKRTPKKLTTPYFNKKSAPLEEENWRSAKSPETPVADLLLSPPKEKKQVAKLNAPVQTIPIKPTKQAVIDLTKAFEKDAKRVDVAPPAPPNSPVINAGSDAYGLDPSFMEYMQYDQLEYYAADPEERLTDYVVQKDLDYDRRRAYLKRQITDGEVMTEIDGWKLCLIFVHGIEYHYCVKDGVCQWDLPVDEPLAQKCKDWYLVLPKSKRKKYGLEVPPAPLECDEPAHAPRFTPLVYHNELVLF